MKREQYAEMKNVGPNPTWGKGFRNVFCPYYSDCLDRIIKENWMSWHCSFCGERFNQASKPDLPVTVNHSIAYYELASRIWE